MAFLFIGTGKKQAIAKVLAHFEKQAKRGVIRILATRQLSKKAAFMKYRELRVLMTADNDEVIPDGGLLRSLDYAALERLETLSIKMSTFLSEDEWLKGSLIALTSPFQMRGGRFDILTETKRGEENRQKRRYEFVLSGPKHLTDTYKDLLLEKNMVDPASVEYVF